VKLVLSTFSGIEYGIGLPELIRTRLKDNPEIGGGGGRYHHPLLAAMAKRNKDSVAALLGLSSSVCDGIDITDGLKSSVDSVRKDHTPFSWACEEGHLGIAVFLLQNYNQIGEGDLIRILKNGHIEVIKMLVEKGADVRVTTRGGKTPLHQASEKGHVEIAKLLLEKGADAMAADNDGWTPLHWASEKGDIEIVKLLLENGADVMVADNDGWTPLHKASGEGHVQIVKLLLEKGADVMVADNDGWTPLHWASEKGHVEVVKLLLEGSRCYGCDYG
jgi:ankyrin repeat protein